MTRILILTTAFVLLAIVSHAQISCFTYGKMLSCDGPGNSHSMQVPLSPNMGIVDTDRRTEPYTLYNAPSYRSQPIEPLERLERLPSLGSHRSLDDPFNDPLMGPLLLLGE